MSRPDEPPARILLVEDDTTLRAGLARNFMRLGYEVELAADGDSGLEKATSCTPDLIVLDINLPGLSGLEILQELRRRQDPVPVLILSARGRLEQRIEGLDIGADDYLPKPFELPELLARVAALLRRHRRQQETEPPILAGELRIDPAARQVTRDDQPVTLSAKEFDLLLLLARNPGRSFSRAAILERVWGWDFDGTERTVDNFILALRRKLEPDPAHPQHILTIRQVGYFFSGEVL